MGDSAFGTPTILQSGNCIACPYCRGLNRVKDHQRSAVCDHCLQIFTFYTRDEAQPLVEPLKGKITPERINQLRYKWVESDQMKDDPNHKDFNDLWGIIEKLQIAYERERDSAEALRERLHDRGDEV